MLTLSSTIFVFCRRFCSLRNRNGKLKRLCETGQVSNVFDINLLTFERHKPSDAALNTLLRTCKRLKNYHQASEYAQHIWNKFVSEYQISPSLKTYCFMIHILAKDHQENRRHVFELIKEMKLKYDYNEFSVHDWWALIDTFGLLKDVNNMLHEYYVLLNDFEHIGQNKYILGSVLQGLIRCDETHFVVDIWKNIVCEKSDLSLLCDSFVLQSFIVCLDKYQNYNHEHSDLLRDVWNVIVNQAGVHPDVACYCTAIVAFSRSHQNKEHHQIVLDLVLKIDLCSLKNVHFRQILSACGNIGQFDQMWKIYDDYRALHGNKHNFTALGVIASKETRSEKICILLKIVIDNFDLNTDMSADQLMSFYRVANEYNDQRSIDIIWNVLEWKKNAKMNVASRFWLDNKEYIIDSGYTPNCPFNAIEKVEKLMKQINYVMDVSNVPELPNRLAKEKLLKSHSEKKALAILLFHKKYIRHIKIYVDMRMCNDCHKFFCDVSRVYTDRIIQCIDPKRTHIF